MISYGSWAAQKFGELLWGSSSNVKAPSSETPDTIFEDLALALSNPSNERTEEELTLHFIDKITDDFAKIRFTPSFSFEDVNTQYLQYCSQFNAEIEALSSLTDKDKLRIKSLFQIQCAERITYHWILGAVESFHSLFSLSDRRERIGETQKWAFSFFVGAHYLHSLEKNRETSFQDFSEVLAHQTLENFDTYFQKEIQRQEKIQSRSFLPPPSITLALIEEKKQLMQKCIEIGYPLQIGQNSILKGRLSEQLFSEAFLAYENGK